MAASFQQAAAAAAGAGSAPTLASQMPHCRSLQLQSLHFGSHGDGFNCMALPSAVLQHVPALTDLVIGLAPQMNKLHKQLTALSSLTALRSLMLVQTCSRALEQAGQSCWALQTRR
jgi:hypothetical protein